MHTLPAHQHAPHLQRSTQHPISRGSNLAWRSGVHLPHHTLVCRRTLHHTCSATIGFDLPGASQGKGAHPQVSLLTSTIATDVERTAGELVNSAASLLVYRAVMTTKPSQAFLRLLQYLQRGTPQQLLEAYGDLYNQLALAGHSSWMDYVLDQVRRPTTHTLLSSRTPTDPARQQKRVGQGPGSWRHHLPLPPGRCGCL